MFSNLIFESLELDFPSKITELESVTFCSFAWAVGAPANTNDVPISTLAAPK